MFYCLYQITNLVNGKIYVGVHATHNLNDEYMGSGKVIRTAIEKYGVENFKKDILEIFENQELMYAREKEVVNQEFIIRDDVYNIMQGGKGGWHYLNSNSEVQRAKCIRGNQKQKWLKEFDHEWVEKTQQKRSKSMIKQYEDGVRERKFVDWTGRTHSEETKRKMSEFQKVNQAGEKNSQYGTCFVYNLELKSSIRIKKTELEKYLNDGWLKGRKLKF